MVWVIRVSIILVGTGATVIGLTVKTIYGLSILCSDLIYVILFPQLICVLYFRYSNGYGAIFSFAVGMVLRILGGEKLLGNKFICNIHLDLQIIDEKLDFLNIQFIIFQSLRVNIGRHAWMYEKMGILPFLLA